MIIAVTYSNGEIQHFGQTKQFKLYFIEDNQIASSRIIDSNNGGFAVLDGFMEELWADALICDGIGGAAQIALTKAGIQLFGGVSGNADAAAEELVASDRIFHSASGPRDKRKPGSKRNCHKDGCAACPHRCH